MLTISFDVQKRDKTLAERNLDFADAAKVLSGVKFEFQDNRFDYPETRIVTVGLLDQRMIVVVWTPKDDAHHIISMRKANDREQKRYRKYLD